MNEFLGVPFIRLGESARMWFKSSEVSKALHVGKAVLEKTLAEGKATPFAAVQLPASHPSVDKKAGVAQFYDADYLLAAAYHFNTAPARQLRSWLVYTLSNLAADGFVTLQNYKTPPELRQKLIAHLCGVEHYFDIVWERFDPSHPSHGTNLAPADCNIEALCNPDNYISREELTRLKALDLAIYLLDKHFSVSTDSVLQLINVVAREATEEDRAALFEWLSAQEL